MQAFGNMARMAYRPAAPEYRVVVNNSAARDVSARASFDADVLKIAIDRIVGDGIAKGRHEGSFSQREARNGGRGAPVF